MYHNHILLQFTRISCLPLAIISVRHTMIHKHICRKNTQTYIIKLEFKTESHCYICLFMVKCEFGWQQNKLWCYSTLKAYVSSSIGRGDLNSNPKNYLKCSFHKTLWQNKVLQGVTSSLLTCLSRNNSSVQM